MSRSLLLGFLIYGLLLAGSATVRGEIEYHQGISTHNLAKVRASIQYAGRDA